MICIYLFSSLFYFVPSCFHTNIFLFIMVFLMTVCPELEIKAGSTVVAELRRGGGDRVQLHLLFFHSCTVTQHIPFSFAVPSSPHCRFGFVFLTDGPWLWFLFLALALLYLVLILLPRVWYFFMLGSLENFCWDGVHIFFKTISRDAN